MTKKDKELLKYKDTFEKFRVSYPGKKKGLEREWANFILRQTKPVGGENPGIPFDGKLVVLCLVGCVMYQKAARKWEKDNGIFVPPWKNITTWINQGCWEDEHAEYNESCKQEKKTLTKQISTEEADKLFGKE